jgi:phenylacetate-CoA ligase
MRAEDVTGPKDLAALPLLTKEIVTQRLPELLAGNIGPSRRVRRATGGSSGTPLAFYVEGGRTDPLERAFIGRAWGWMGVRFEDRAVVLKGLVVAARDLRAGRYWQTYYPERNWTFFSSHHMSEQTLPLYARRFRELKPAFIQSLPTALDMLARYWIREGLPPLAGLKMLHVASETLRPDQRARFEQAFGARVFSTYGQSECSVLAGECEQNTAYHVFPEYGVTEIVRPDGTPAAPGELGEVVGTGFNNYVLPLIRYRTGDLAAWSPGRCACGRAFPLLERLEGRGQDVAVARDGHVIPFNALVFGVHLPEYGKIKEMQGRQTTPGEITLAVVPYPDYTDEVGRVIAARLEDAADGGLRFQVEVVAEIERTPSGKFKSLEQQLPADWWNGYRPGGPGA